MAQARIAAIVGLLAWAGAAAAAPVPVSPEFQINTYTVLDQGYPVVCRSADGPFVVTWETYRQDGDLQGIAVQRFDGEGQPLGTEFLANTFTPGRQQLPEVTCAAEGGFVVVWESFAQDGDDYGIFSRRYDSAGASVGGEIQVNLHTVDRQLSASACFAPSGGFVITWHSYDQDGYSYGVFGQRFDGGGARAGGEFQINVNTSGTQEFPAVGCDGQGGFAVVWHADLQDGDTYGIFGRRFASDGSPLGAEFQVNTYTYYNQQLPSIASATDGSFVVVWETYNFQDGDSYGVFGRRFASDGTALGDDFQVNAYTPGSQVAPDLALGPDGAFTVAWSSTRDGDYGYGVFAQQFSSDGARVGGEFQVNTYTVGYQGSFDAIGTVLSIGSDQDGNFVVVWQSVDLFDVSQDGDGFGIFGRRFEIEPSPSCGSTFPMCDGVCPEGQTCTVAGSDCVCIASTPTPTATPSAVVSSTPTPPLPCPGDVDSNGEVTVAEMIVGVQMALGELEVTEAFDLDGDGAVSVVELIAAVEVSMGECPT